MARANIGGPVPGSENQESVTDKWQKHENMRRKKRGDAEFFKVKTTNNLNRGPGPAFPTGPTGPTNPKPKPDNKDKGGNNGGNGNHGNGGNKNDKGNGGKGHGDKGGGNTAAPRR